MAVGVLTKKGNVTVKRTILAVLCLLALAPPLRAQEGNTKEQDIRRLLELTGSTKMAEQIMDQMMAAFEQNAPGIPKAFWDRFRAEINTEDLLSMTIPIYDKNFSHEDIRGLIAFYQTPLGATLIEKLPIIAQESMAAGMKWGEEIGQKAVAKLQAQEEKKDQP
ncbi:MAG: hypothetical protein QOH06_3196 [Acidobacteriota bacterium]|jgi:hypothetical protein|nr:hypothetical protein [Acidobacteriota bacterium]